MIKSSIITITLCLIFVSCKENIARDVNKEINDQISLYYTSAMVEDYSPIKSSELDTIQHLKNPDGTLIRLQGEVLHEFKAKSNLNGIMNYNQIFEVTIYKDELIAIPKQ